MTSPKIIRFLLPLLLLTADPAPAADPQPAGFAFRVVATDPAPDSYLAAGERLYLRIDYESPVAVRFEVEAVRQGEVQKAAGRNSTPPHDPGHGEALAWLAMTTPIRIDELRVTAFDLEWQELGTLTTPTVITWEHQDQFEPREPAGWVAPLLKLHRRAFDEAFDPFPEKPRPLFDFFFTLSFLAIPLYLLLQTQMLARYRGRWQWYAAAPLLPLVPLALYSLIGLGLSKEFWVKFLFHYLAVALLYLLIVWVVKRDREKTLRAASKHHPVDSAAGTE